MDFSLANYWPIRPLGFNVPKALDHQWDLFRLGIMATVEHMTCVLGKYALYNKEWERLVLMPNMLDLVKWHGAEEIEHRTVAFDLISSSRWWLYFTLLSKCDCDCSSTWSMGRWCSTYHETRPALCV